MVLTTVILFLGASCVAAMMLTRFDAMAVQLAVLRALGYTKASIGGWLLWEGFILGSMASLVGGLFDFAVFPWIRSVIGLEIHPYIVNPTFHSALVWLAAIVATMVAVSIPILRLYRQDIHSSLKGF